MKYLFGLIAVVLMMGCDDRTVTFAPSSSPATPGTGIAVLVDISGSMEETVDDNGKPQVKEVIARNSVINVIQRCQDFSNAHPNQVIKLGVIQFDDQHETVVAFDKPNAASAKSVINKMQPRGGTAIGDAVIAAKEELNVTGLTSKHIIVITDGENNTGKYPSDVADALNALPAADKASVYVIAFDTSASQFDAVKKAGWTVLSASNAQELQGTLSTLLGDEILLER